jgi:hypothetical protein
MDAAPAACTIAALVAAALLAVPCRRHGRLLWLPPLFSLTNGTAAGTSGVTVVVGRGFPSCV